MAERQAARRLAKRKDKAQREWAKSNREQVNFARRDEITQIKNAKLVRREDYELGPLAPRRDVGDSKETYGTIIGQRIRGQPLDHRKIEKVMEPFGGKYLNIVPEDRVVLIEGRDKGKIGKVSKIDARNGELTVEGLNMVNSSPHQPPQERQLDQHS
jgi:large subunit ribosomal protein L24